MAEGVEILLLSSVDMSQLRQIAELGTAAWGRAASGAEIERLSRTLAGEIAELDPCKKGLFIAETRGQIVGFARVAQDRNNAQDWWLMGICVHPGHRRQGIGKALVRACIAYAQERGAMLIRSETHSDNEASIRFHESIGFANTGGFIAADGDQKVGFRLELPGAAGGAG